MSFLINCISSVESSKSKIWKFSSIRDGVIDFGNAMVLRWMCHLNTICETVLPWTAAMGTRVSSLNRSATWLLFGGYR